MKTIFENVWVRTILGVALMVGGFWVSKNWHPEFLKPLAETGVDIDLGKTVATIGVLLIIFPVIRAFFIDPLQQAIEERNSGLERTFTEAEGLRTQMETMRSDYERRLQETEAQAREQIQTQIREAQALGQQLKAEAAQRYDQMIAQAQDQITIERERVLTDLRLTVADLTLRATEKVLGENMDTERNRRLIDDFLDKAEVPR